MPTPQKQSDSLNAFRLRVDANYSKLFGDPPPRGEIKWSTGPNADEDRQFNVVTLVALSFFVGAFWGVVGMAIWYSFNP